MKKFISGDFFLKTETAKYLYKNVAKKCPIYDYHCHLSPKEIAEDKQFKNITDLWLSGDHYKWRVLRSNGIDEDLITGEADDYEKFLAFAKTIPYTIGNPMYHWTHLELQRYFNIDETLNEKSAPMIWEKCNELINTKGFTAKNLIIKSGVEVICTTDDPTDDLKYHKILLEDKEFKVKVRPTFRPDKGLNIDQKTFIPWLKKLEQIVGYSIDSLETFKKALKDRIKYFNELGCKLSDHSLEVVSYKRSNIIDDNKVNEIFKKAINGKLVEEEETVIFKSNILHFLGKQYTKYNWVMQLHIGALRNNNTRMFNVLGPDSGFDSINDGLIAEQLSALLDDLDKTNELPKTILYVLNPRDNYVIGTMIGNFQSGGIKGKIQFGSGWWFNDQKDGMIDQMKTLANLGVLSTFVGMLTDSRSFISYTRHEYFRRILCNLIGEWVEAGEYPDDKVTLSKIVEDICINNAREYFGI